MYILYVNKQYVYIYICKQTIYVYMYMYVCISLSLSIYIYIYSLLFCGPWPPTPGRRCPSPARASPYNER